MSGNDNVIRPVFGGTGKRMRDKPSGPPASPDHRLIDLSDRRQLDQDDVDPFRLDLDFGDKGSLFDTIRDLVGPGMSYGGTRAQRAECSRVGNILDSLHFQDNPAKIQSQRAQVDQYEDEQLFGLIGNATEQDVKIKPYFWRAMLESAKGRLHRDE